MASGLNIAVYVNDEPMDTIESAKRKRMEEEAEYQNSIQQAKAQKIISGGSSVEPINDDLGEQEDYESDLLKFQFIQEDSFKSKQYEVFSDIATPISNEWTFVCFTDEHKACIFREPNKDKRKVFCDITSLKIADGTDIEVKISSIASAGEKGISFDRFLIPYTVEQLQEAFDSQGVTKVAKIKKKSDNEIEYDTGSIIVEFSGTVKNLLFRGIELTVTKLALKPMQCTHCGVIGHTKRKCKKINLLLCKKCLQNHDQDQDCCAKCINCGLIHHSLNKLCHAIKNEREILQIKEKFNLRYFDAKDLWAKQNKIESNNKREGSILFNDKQSTRKLQDQVEQLKISEKNINKKLVESKEEIVGWREKIGTVLVHCENYKTASIEKTEEVIRLKKENFLLKQESDQQISQLTSKFKADSHQTKSDLDEMFKGMETLKARIKEQDDMVESIGKQLQRQKSVFGEFVNFSDKTITEYHKFCQVNKKKIDTEYLPTYKLKTRKDSV